MGICKAMREKHSRAQTQAHLETLGPAGTSAVGKTLSNLRLMLVGGLLELKGGLHCRYAAQL
jgi:hypothetical protein